MSPLRIYSNTGSAFWRLARLIFVKPYSTLFSLAVATAVISFIVMYAVSLHIDLKFVTLTGDANAYRIAAENLIKYREFTLSDSPPLYSESFRSPGYPLFLAILYIVFQAWPPVIFIQSLLLAAVPILFYALFSFIDRRAAFIASVVFIFEPTRIFISNSLLTDAFFTGIFGAALFFLVRAMRSVRLDLLVLSSVVLGFATLTRPIAMFFPVVAVLFILLQSMPVRAKVQFACVFLLTFAVVVVPWSVRNYVIFGSWQLSSVSSYNLAYYNAAEFEKYRTGKNIEEILAPLKEREKEVPYREYNGLARLDVFNEYSSSILSGNEVGYVMFHLFKMIPFFITDGLRDIASTLKLTTDMPPNFGTAILRGDWHILAGFFFSGNMSVLLFVIGISFWSLVFMLAGIGFLRAFSLGNYDQRLAILLFVATIGYFAILTGPVANARFRLPAEAFLLFGASCGFLMIWQFVSHRLSKHETHGISQ